MPAWQAYDGTDKDDFIVSYDGNDGEFELVGFEPFFGGAKFTGGAAEADTSVTFDTGNALKNDLVASGNLEITDAEGVQTVAVTTQGTYGTLTLTAPTGDGDIYAWTYTLDPTDPDTAGLSVGETTETITLTVTDVDGATNTHNITITLTVQASAAPVPPVLGLKTAGDDAGAVTEDGTVTSADGVITFSDDADANADLTITTALASGVGTAPDDPAAATVTTAFAASITGTYGTFTLTRDDTNGELELVLRAPYRGTGAWRRAGGLRKTGGQVSGFGPRDSA